MKKGSRRLRLTVKSCFFAFNAFNHANMPDTSTFSRGSVRVDDFFLTNNHFYWLFQALVCAPHQIKHFSFLLQITSLKRGPILHANSKSEKKGTALIFLAFHRLCSLAQSVSTPKYFINIFDWLRVCVHVSNWWFRFRFFLFLRSVGLFPNLYLALSLLPIHLIHSPCIDSHPHCFRHFQPTSILYTWVGPQKCTQKMYLFVNKYAKNK